jgi:Signal transduction histidine kinase
LIRESIEVEGVAFLDASIETFGGLVEDGSRKAREAYARDATSGSDDSITDSETTPGLIGFSVPKLENDDHTTCRILGSSTSNASSIDDHKPHEFAMRESLLRVILNRYPHGKIFNYNENGSVSDDNSSGGTYSSSERTSGSETKRKRRRPNHRQDASDLIKVLVGARSIIFLPLWDSHRSKWFSGILVWTNTPKRVFIPESELTYLRAFGNSVMAEIHRLDVEMAERAKTNLVSSISHELRSPLHGILGTANVLSDTAMNALQQGMVHTIESCGRTLLDTINHVLDFTYIDKFKDGSAKKKHAHRGQLGLPDRPKPNLKRASPNSSDNSHAPVQLDAVLEEVVESMFAGHSFYNDPLAHPRDVGSSNSTPSPPKPVTVIFDIQEAADWAFLTQAGCWRRILMNVFGNALKYTLSGFIYLGVKVSPLPHPESDDCTNVESAGDRTSQYLVTLTAKDTGKGISAKYLRNDLFTPFSQEDSLAPGSGLGLSIVREALISLGGSIDVSSEKNRGTEISIEVPLSLVSKPDTTSDDSSSHSSENYNSIRNLAHGKTLCLVGFGSSLESERDIALYKSLERLCRDWFQLTVEAVSVESAFLRRESNPPDFYLMVQTDLDSPDFEGNELLNFDRLTNGEQGGVSPLIVICQSPETAHNMFVRASGRNGKSVVEFISQPCGPRKLAKALDMCMHRREDQKSGAGANEPTRWVELPESSCLPLDIGPRNPPDERLKISKRPTTLDMGANRDNENYKNTPENQIENAAFASDETPPPGNTATQYSDNSQPSVLLVDDNEVNLQILVAFVKKEGWSYMTASNGLEAVETYQAHPGKFGAIIIGMLISFCFFQTTNKNRHLDACHGRF